MRLLILILLIGAVPTFAQQRNTDRAVVFGGNHKELSPSGSLRERRRDWTHGRRATDLRQQSARNQNLAREVRLRLGLAILPDPIVLVDEDQALLTVHTCARRKYATTDSSTSIIITRELSERVFGANISSGDSGRLHCAVAHQGDT